MENLSKTKKASELFFSKSSWWLGEIIIPKEDDPEWKFQTYRGTNLDFDMLRDPIRSDNKEKEGDNPSVNRLINLKIDNQHRECFSVPIMCI